MKKALLLSVAGSFFFAFTFILNRSMHLSGGSWVWSAGLRYLFTLPIMALLTAKRFGFKNVHRAIFENKRGWVLWSCVGFGLFYAPISYAGDHGESWLIAASWQMTIVMGVLMAPLFKKKIPVRNLCASGIILLGVLLLQLKNIVNFQVDMIAMTLFPILLAAIAYPLGNRKMMEICGDDLSAMERIYGMTFCSMPFWCVLMAFGLLNTQLPSSSQVFQSFGVAVFAGVIATLLFFKATNLVKDNQKQLAVIESTQSGEVIFTLLGGVIFLNDAPPDLIGAIGIALIIVGMVFSAIVSSSRE